MLKTSGIPFSERQVLDVIYGPSDDPRWHSFIEPHELDTFTITSNTSNSTEPKIITDNFEVIEF